MPTFKVRYSFPTLGEETLLVEAEHVVDAATKTCARLSDDSVPLGLSNIHSVERVTP